MARDFEGTLPQSRRVCGGNRSAEVLALWQIHTARLLTLRFSTQKCAGSVTGITRARDSTDRAQTCLELAGLGIDNC
jgi:hypothetical protein